MYPAKKPFGLALVSAAFLFTPMMASGETATTPPGGGAQQAAPTAQVDPATVEKFVVAFADVRELQQEFSLKLQNAESPEEAQSLQQEAQQEMVGAVKEAGLEVEDYNRVVSAMEQDPQLRNEILSRAQ
jgi:hypothetical protein